MDRRTFLTRSALGGALTLGAPAIASTGCGASVPAPRLADSDARALIERLERGLAGVRDVPPGAMARAMPSHPEPELAERVLRLGLEALVVLDVTRSVPEHAGLPGALSERLAPELPVLDRYTATYHAILAGMPHASRRGLSSKLRERPGATMEIAGWVDEHARRLGVATESRLLLRGQAAEVDVRMRRQSPGAVIDDCLGKMERAVERSGTSIALARGTATSAMIAAVWQQGEPVSGMGRVLDLPGGQALSPAEQRRREDLEWTQITTPDRQLWSARWARPGDEELEIGGILAPFGLVTCGLLLIVGLLVVLVGAAQNASWDGMPRVLE